MSQEDSKWLVNGLFHLLLNGIYWGEITHLLTIDPIFQRDIQVEVSSLVAQPSKMGAKSRRVWPIPNVRSGLNSHYFLVKGDKLINPSP